MRPLLPVTAGVDDFGFASLDVDYTLGRAANGSSTLEVVERFVAVFPEFDQNRGMRRLVPDTYLGVPLNPEFVSITDGEGRERPAEVEHEDGVFSMTSRADEYVHGSQTYVFTYTLENVDALRRRRRRRVLLERQRPRMGPALRPRDRDAAPR